MENSRLCFRLKEKAKGGSDINIGWEFKARIPMYLKHCNIPQFESTGIHSIMQFGCYNYCIPEKGY
jgi:hypothetical protein